MNIKSKITPVAMAIAALTLGACATLPGSMGGQYASSPTHWTEPQAQQVEQVRIGTVLAVRSVEIAPSVARTGVGSGVGALVGGLLGHQVGGGKGKTLATVAGAVGGAVAGNVVTRHAYRQPGLAITVHVTDGWGAGQTEQITQAIARGIEIRPGEQVEIVGQGCGPWASQCRDPARVIPLPASTAATSK